MNRKITRRNKIIITFGLIALLLIASGIMLYRATVVDNDPIPTSIRSRLTFSPFVIPMNTTKYTTSNYVFAIPEGAVDTLSYTITSKDGQTITLSEYTQPQQFNDIPDYKNQFLSNVIQQYDTVQTVSGAINLGHLTKQHNKQVGVMIERGLLVFLNPSTDLSSSQWRSLGDQFVIQKIDN
ncbi:hypothetical protein EPN95_02315 [Patescibacteria group bacterium]|nr:MAG: hypothetical protein EPN95_02315 [Patescibacteria group bacterium]